MSVMLVMSATTQMKLIINFWWQAGHVTVLFAKKALDVLVRDPSTIDVRHGIKVALDCISEY